MGVSPKVHADMQLQGGRHYRGRGLGQLKAWQCPACGAQNAGRALTAGCASCGAGAPGQQVRRPGEPIPKADEKAVRDRTQDRARAHTPAPAGSPVSRRPTSLAEQVRGRPTSVDYDEIERRLARVLEERLGGGYTSTERARLYDALEVMIALWEDGRIVPTGGLSLEQTRILAQKVAPEEMEMADGNSPTTTETARERGSSDAEPDPDGSLEPDPDDADGGAREPVPRTRRPADAAGGVLRPAPELLDPDHRGDQGGQDDPAGDGS